MMEELEDGHLHDEDDTADGDGSNEAITHTQQSDHNASNDDTRSNFDDDLRELKYQYRSLPVRVFYLYIWPRLNYFWIHLIYISFLSIMGGAFVWWSEQGNPYYSVEGRKPLTYIDATLSACSAATSTGLATLDFWGLRTSSQIIHLILTQLNGSVFIAAMTAFIRRLSLGVWLSKHPQRECREADNIIYCHEALHRLGLTLLSFNFFVILIGWILITIYSNTAIESTLKSESVNPTYFSFFTVVCAFNQSGFTLMREGLVPFSNHFFLAFIISVIILISNMFLPVVIRMIISVIAKFSKKPEPWKFMLDHPRICSTILFPALQTKILAGCITAFFTLQMVLFALLNFSYPILEVMTGWQQFVVSFFQAANTMQAGFPVLEIPETNTAQQWCYFIFMLVAVYPYVSMLRNTEVVREGRDFFHPDSLLKQSSRMEEFEKQLHQGSRVGRANIVWDHSMQHLKQTFLGDAFWLIFAVFLICLWEGESIENDHEFSMWKVIFEVASAYGNVGLSLGYPEIATGFSMIFSQKAKIVIMGVMILGRHREMPRQRDVAVMQVEILAKSS